MRYIISCILLLASLLTAAQKADSTKVADTTVIVADTTTTSYMPTGIRIGVDVLRLGRSLSNNDLNSILFTADIDFYRYFLVAEYGQYSRTRTSQTNDYSTEGDFFRTGVDINFFHKQPDKSVFSVGMRYAVATFNEKLTSSYADPIFGPGVNNYANNDLKADWVELVVGLKVPVWKFWLGYNGRLKFWAGAFEDQKFKPYEIPGYGYAADKGNWEFNYYIMYRIGWK